MPPKIKPQQALHLAEALARGEPNRTRIGITLFRDAVDEGSFASAPSGMISRLVETVEDALGGGDGEQERAAERPGSSQQPPRP